MLANGVNGDDDDDADADDGFTLVWSLLLGPFVVQFVKELV